MVSVIICKHVFIFFMHATPVKICKPSKCMFPKMRADKEKYCDFKPNYLLWA